MAVAAMAMLCTGATDTFGQLIRPSLTTHLLVFGLGVLYGGMRRAERRVSTHSRNESS